MNAIDASPPTARSRALRLEGSAKITVNRIPNEFPASSRS